MILYIMSFSILTLPTPLTIQEKVFNEFQNNVHNPALEGQLLKICILDGTKLSYRLMQRSIAMMYTPVNSTVQTALVLNVPTSISLVGSVLNSNINFVMNTDSKITYTGTDTPNLGTIKFNLNAYSTVNSQIMNIQARKNTINIIGATQTFVIGNGIATICNVHIGTITTLNNNDIIDFTITNTTASNPIVIYNFNAITELNFS